MKTKLKVSRTGWVARNVERHEILYVSMTDMIGLDHVYENRDSKSDWASLCWPPRKVRVTVEEI